MSRIFAVLLIFIASSFALADSPPIFRQAVGDYALAFPRDHGSHPDFETEWWYVTGHLAGESGDRYGFEIVFFRVGVKQAPELRSAWRMDSFSFAHFAVTDDARSTFRDFKRRSRGSFGQAEAAVGALDVRLRDWKLVMDGGGISLAAKESGTALSLKLAPKKPVVLHGENGLSRKGPGPGDASYYSSFTRLEGSGELTLDGRTMKITHASAWLDHEFTSSKLARGTEGWDWFAIQLDNGEEVMVYNLRKSDGGKSEYSSGTWVDTDGESRRLGAGDFHIEPLAHWMSPRTEIRYPAKWRVDVPSENFTAVITPTVADQELVTEGSAGVTYWEGRSTVSAEKAGGSVSGNAYVELVGYGAKK